MTIQPMPIAQDFKIEGSLFKERPLLVFQLSPKINKSNLVSPLLVSPLKGRLFFSFRYCNYEKIPELVFNLVMYQMQKLIFWKKTIQSLKDKEIKTALEKKVNDEAKLVIGILQRIMPLQIPGAKEELQYVQFHTIPTQTTYNPNIKKVEDLSEQTSPALYLKEVLEKRCLILYEEIEHIGEIINGKKIYKNDLECIRKEITDLEEYLNSLNSLQESPQPQIEDKE